MDCYNASKTRTRLPASGLAVEGAGVVAGGTRAVTPGAGLLPGMVLPFAATPAPGAGAALLLLELPPGRAFATTAGSTGAAGGRAEGCMGYGEETGMPMRARSGCPLVPLEDPFPLLSCGVITATICAAHKTESS